MTFQTYRAYKEGKLPWAEGLKQDYQLEKSRLKFHLEALEEFILKYRQEIQSRGKMNLKGSWYHMWVSSVYSKMLSWPTPETVFNLNA